MEFEDEYEKIMINAGPHEGEQYTIVRFLPEIRLAYRVPVRPWNRSFIKNEASSEMGVAEYKRVRARHSRNGTKQDFWLPADWHEDAVGHWLDRRGFE